MPPTLHGKPAVGCFRVFLMLPCYPEAFVWSNIEVYMHIHVFSLKQWIHSVLGAAELTCFHTLLYLKTHSLPHIITQCFNLTPPLWFPLFPPASPRGGMWLVLHQLCVQTAQVRLEIEGYGVCLSSSGSCERQRETLKLSHRTSRGMRECGFLCVSWIHAGSSHWNQLQFWDHILDMWHYSRIQRYQGCMCTEKSEVFRTMKFFRSRPLRMLLKGKD